MGMYSSTTTTKLPEKTEDEKALDALQIDVILPAYLESIGFDVTQVKNEDGSIDYTYELNDTGKAMQEINAKSLEYQSEAMDQFNEVYKKFSSGDYSITDEQKALINEQMGGVRDAVFAMLDEAQKTAEDTGTSINSAIDDYVKQINETGLSVGAALSAVEDRIKLNKDGLLAGISEEEKRVGETGNNVRAALKGVMDEINKTGDQTRAVYEDLFETKKVLVANQMKDVYDQNQKKTAERANLLGRSPMDPKFQNELLDNLQKNIKNAQLELSAQESEALAGLEERTGQRREQLKLQEAGFEESQGGKMEALGAKRTAVEDQTGQQLTGVAGQRADLAQRQGQALEGAANQRTGVAERTGAAKEQIAGKKAALEEDLQKTGFNLQQQYGVGIPASQIGLGMDVAGFNQATNAQNIALQSGAFGFTSNMADKYLKERMAQPTTTSDPGFGNVLGGIIGTVASGAGSILGGIGSLRTFK